MATQVACPTCSTPMREIVWGYGTIADVADAGDVVIGGCVVDVDAAGRVAALQCPACGTRADAQGVALEPKEPPATTEHPFAVAFSNPLPSRGVVTMTDQHQQSGGALGAPGASGADSSPFVDEDFGGIASGSDWRDHIEPYASREDALPERSAASPDRVDPYASRQDAIPPRSAPAPDHVEPYASRDDAMPPRSAASPDRVAPYASREDALPSDGGAWRERIEPFSGDAEQAGGVDDDASPGMAEPAGMDAADMDTAGMDAAGMDAAGRGATSRDAAGVEVVGDGFDGDAVDAGAAAMEVDVPPGEHVDAHSLDTSDFTDAEEEGWPSRSAPSAP